MNRMLAIYHKEMSTYFRTPIAYFVVAVFMLGTGYFFVDNTFSAGDASMRGTLQNMGILLVTLVPVITMRLFSAEFNGRTSELLLTLPLRPWQIVVGKYLGAVSMLLLMTLGTTINLIPLYLHGNPETSTLLAGYIGFMLLGMACIAVGQCFSAFTENQIVAALLTSTVLLALWFIGRLEGYQNTFFALRGLYRYLSFSLHYGSFIDGLIRSEAVIYYLLVGTTALIVNAAALQWRR